MTGILLQKIMSGTDILKKKKNSHSRECLEIFRKPILREKNILKNAILFRLCTNVRKINFNESFDTSAVQDMEYMFADCKKLEEIFGLENIDTSSVTI